MGENRKDHIQEEIKLKRYLSPAGAWALSVGSAIGWGSFVFTGNQYLLKAGPAGSVIGMIIGMFVMLIIGGCYSILMKRYPDAGGVYAYITAVFGHDRAFLVAWFLFLTYISVLWANATSLPLFISNFAGDLFKFGPHYNMLGYEIWFGEAIMSVIFVLIMGLVCTYGGKLVNAMIVITVVCFTAFILICTAVSLLNRDPVTFSMSPPFIPDNPVIPQILRIACMAPWAYVGFENISHSVEEFDFDHNRPDGLIKSSVVVTTLLYIAIIILSLCSRPAGYDSWIAYISDLDNLHGLTRYPTFHTAGMYMGSVGTVMIATALLCLVISSLIGMMTALSRLMYALGNDDIIPARFSELNSRGVPGRALGFIMAVSCIIPFVGRTAIGWIVDVTTIGTVLVYVFVAAAAYKIGKKENSRYLRILGIAGISIMLLLGIFMQIPSLTNEVSMARESYFLFTVWGVLGFVFFRGVVDRDVTRRFGNSMIVWIGMLALVLFTALTWMGNSTRSAASTAVEEMKVYFDGDGEGDEYNLSEQEFIDRQLDKLGSVSHRNNVVVFGLFILSTITIMSNYRTMKRREKENDEALEKAELKAYRDELTGVKSKHAYSEMEESFNRRIMDGLISDFAVIVCDVNGLKYINDTLGHHAGDEYIKKACTMICKRFKHSPVFRTGGDEFVVVLENDDFNDRLMLMKEFNTQAEQNAQTGDIVIASGVSDFIPGTDISFQQVFERADSIMYERKKELKGIRPVK